MATQQAKKTTASTTAVRRQRAEAKAQAGDEAAKAEASVADSSEKRTVKWDGEEYIIDAVSDWDVEVMEYVDDQRWLAAVRALLGPDQWEKFKKPGRKNSEFFEFVDALFGGGAEVRAE